VLRSAGYAGVGAGALKLVFVGVLKVSDENSRIRIRIRIYLSEAWICLSGSTDHTKNVMDPKLCKKVGFGFKTIISDPDPQHFCLKYLKRAVQRWICWNGCWRCAVARPPPTPCWPRLASPRGSLPSSSLYRYFTNF
jgi:hypothetical protein